MKTRIIPISVIISTVGLLTSCLEEGVLDVGPLASQTILAEIEGPSEAQETRSCVDVTNENTSFIGMLWQPGDKIGVYSKDGKSRNNEFSCTATMNVPQAEFSGEMSGIPHYAYFPYSADNANNDITAIQGRLLSEQPFDNEKGTLICDYKYGTRATDGTNNFNFKQLFTMLRITIDASETGLEGDFLNKIVLKVTDSNGNPRSICGDFTFSAIDGEWNAMGNTSNSVYMPWTTSPQLIKGKTYLGFITVMPVIKKNDKISIEVTTDSHKASFTAECKIDLQAGYVYNIPLTLKEYMNNDKFGYKEQPYTRPTITSFSFEVEDNTGKLINNQLVWNSSQHTPSFNNVTTLTADIDQTKNEITLTIPYLYDFKLKPTFTYEGGVQVMVNGEKQVSGESEVDFKYPITYSVLSNDGESREYTVTVTNTGLPVVVVEHSKLGNFDTVRKNGYGVVLNKFVDFMIRGKDTDWVETDQISVYLPDGTVDVDHALCGVRLRGNTTQEYPKKPFAVKLKSKASVLGMPAHKRWVLLANWLDHSMVRNAVAFDIAHAIEYAVENHNLPQGIPWNVHGQNVELIVYSREGVAHHVGNYYLCEQIKIDGDRLDIKDSYEDVIKENSSPTLGDCGYLLELDSKEDTDPIFKTSNGVPVKFKDDAIKGTTLFNQVKVKVQDIEDKLDAGNYAEAYKQLDINSLVDQFLIWELTMNREYGDPGSVYMFMDGNGKLSAGPVWDFDRGTFQNQEKARELGNSDSYRVKPDNAWMFTRSQESESYSYIWYRQLAKDETFRQTVQQRWAVIKPYLDQVASQISSYAETQTVSYKYNSAMWPTNKADIREYKSDFKDWSGDEQLGTDGNYQEVINNLVTVYQERLAGMDALIQQGKFTK